MHAVCPRCNLRYERAPGYFLGSLYINYGLTVLTMTAAYIGLHFGADVSNRVLVGPLLTFCVLFPTFFFRYARAIWLAFDCYFDITGFEQDQD